MMTPAELDAVLADRHDLNPFEESLIAALREAWAVLDAASVVQDDLVRQRDLAQITMAEDAGRRIMDLTAEVERLREVVLAYCADDSHAQACALWLLGLDT